MAFFLAITARYKGNRHDHGHTQLHHVQSVKNVHFWEMESPFLCLWGARVMLEAGYLLKKPIAPVNWSFKVRDYGRLPKHTPSYCTIATGIKNRHMVGFCVHGHYFTCTLSYFCIIAVFSLKWEREWKRPPIYLTRPCLFYLPPFPPSYFTMAHAQYF